MPHCSAQDVRIATGPGKLRLSLTGFFIERFPGLNTTLSQATLCTLFWTPPRFAWAAFCCATKFRKSTSRSLSPIKMLLCLFLDG